MGGPVNLSSRFSNQQRNQGRWIDRQRKGRSDRKRRRRGDRPPNQESGLSIEVGSIEAVSVEDVVAKEVGEHSAGGRGEGKECSSHWQWRRRD
ncbi:hypothetical protein BHM03_00046405 [Ensete ventricosum]|nr:hypothetical protein BHM03_00046405 [Ensete ventricosum]